MDIVFGLLGVCIYQNDDVADFPRLLPSSIIKLKLQHENNRCHN